MRSALLVVFVALAGVFAPTALAGADGIFSAQFTGQSDYVDPIASPGVYPTEHRHMFACAVDVTPTSTSADLRAGGTSCVETGNHSGYWIIRPTQLVNGVPEYLPPATSKNMLAYYDCKHGASICSSIGWFPENFGEIAGNSHATSADDNPILNHPDLSGYRCGTGGGQFSNAPPATCDTTLVMGVTYGNCLMADGSTSMLVGNNCLSMGGTPIIRRQQYWRFKPLHPNLSDLMLDGDHPTWQLHADILDGWKPETSQDFLDRFVHPQVDGGQNPQLTG